MESIDCLVEDLRTAASKLASSDLVGLDNGELEGLLTDVNSIEATLRAAVVKTVGEIDCRGLQSRPGLQTVASHVADLLGLHHGSARATASLAHKQRFLAHTMAALEAGEISEARAQIIGRAHQRRLNNVFQRDEPLLVDKARTLSHKDFYWFIERWKDAADPDRGRDRAERALQQRRLHCSRVGDSVVTNAVSDPISGATLKGAIERVEQELFEIDWAWTQERYGDEATAGLMPRTSAQRRHDALVLLAERGSSTPADANPPEPLVNIVCDKATFEEAIKELAGGVPDYRQVGRCELVDQAPIHPLQAVEQALLGHVARVVFGADDIIINAGRTRRLFSKRMKALLAINHNECSWKGCQLPYLRCQIDHRVSWEDGGLTNIANADPLCGYHNRLKHKRKRDFRSSW